jgi:hypothetical protein
MSWEQILEVFINQLDDEEQQFGYLQHDGATAQTTKANTAYLQQFSDDHLKVNILIQNGLLVPLTSLLSVFQYLRG